MEGTLPALGPCQVELAVVGGRISLEAAHAVAVLRDSRGCHHARLKKVG